MDLENELDKLFDNSTLSNMGKCNISRETTLDFPQNQKSENISSGPLPLTHTDKKFENLAAPSYNSNKTDKVEVNKVAQAEPKSNKQPEQNTAESIKATESQITEPEPQQEYIYDLPDETNQSAPDKSESIKIEIDIPLKQVIKKMLIFGCIILLSILIALSFDKKNGDINNMVVAAAPTTKYEVSTRFNNIDELTEYIESNQQFLMECELNLALQLKKGEIDKNRYAKLINEYITAANELDELLRVNEKNYISNKMSDKYNELSTTMNQIIAYGSYCN